MMMSKTNVLFRYDGITTSDQTVYLVGDGVLGDWNPQDSIKMTKKRSPYDPKQFFWQVSVMLDTGIPINYKYLIKGKDRMIKWETRKEEHRSIVPVGDEMVVNDTFLTIEQDDSWLSEGWLTSEHQVRIELGYNNPLTGEAVNPIYWNDENLNSKTVYLHFYDSEQMIYQDIISVPLSKWTEVVFHVNDVKTFSTSIEFYCYNEDREHTFLGKSVIKGKHLDMRGMTSTPIYNHELDNVGDFYFKYLIITPFRHKLNNLSAMMKSLSSKPTGKNVGHRGCGSTTTTFISENTLLSFLTAARYGADYVEFDIQMTKDKVPVIHHDFSVCMINEDNSLIDAPISSLTEKQFKLLHPNVGYNFTDKHYFKKKPLKKSRSFTDLTPLKKKFQIDNAGSKDSDLKLVCETSELLPKRHTINIRDSFATLAETLTTIPPEVGFVIEIKYPAERYQVAENIRYHERNLYIDTILNTVFDTLTNPVLASRKIMLISFDPDICTLLSQKQPRYPVFFLMSLGKGMPITSDDNEVEGYDVRCNSFEEAIHFAKKIRLAGIILDALYIINNPDKVAEAHKLGLIVMTYGSQNMKESERDIQKKAGVDSFIMDNFVHIGGGLRKKAEVSQVA